MAWAPLAPSRLDEKESKMATQPASAVPELGELLRYWRQERGKSQLDLSLDAGISQRHLSFVESGRSVPSRDFLSTVSDALNIPLRERNVLLLASGYAPLYSEQSMDAEQMAIVTRAIDRMLQQHERIPRLCWTDTEMSFEPIRPRRNSLAHSLIWKRDQSRAIFST
jgi:transcriptional regulator with XRE-family HTH domain